MEEWRKTRWKPYEVSSLGRVRRAHDAAVNPGRIIEGNINSKGYRRFYANENGKGKSIPVHRAVCEAFRGAGPSDRHQVAHGDGDRGNNRADNLRWALPQENWADRYRHGTDTSGERNPRAKLSSADVKYIRTARETGATMPELAKQFGVSKTMIFYIVHRNSWGVVQ